MSENKNMGLFKEHCNRSVDYETKQEELLNALESDYENRKLTCLNPNNPINMDEILKEDNDKALFKLLFGDTKIEHVGRVHDGKMRKECEGCDVNEPPEKGKDYEKRICRCLFYHNKDNVTKNCEHCKYKKNYFIVDSSFSICDYEDPSFYEGKGIGKVDIVLTDGTDLYATEIKPHNKDNNDNNEETILRMIAEILTYTYNNPIYKKAIAFFNDTPQYDEYYALKERCKLFQIMDLAKINVFLITDIENKHEKFKIEQIRKYDE